jgi:hypothetical protein
MSPMGFYLGTYLIATLILRTVPCNHIWYPGMELGKYGDYP